MGQRKRAALKRCLGVARDGLDLERGERGVSGEHGNAVGRLDQGLDHRPAVGARLAGEGDEHFADRIALYVQKNYAAIDACSFEQLSSGSIRFTEFV